jgi:HK97 gp10 family phage protein
VASNKVKIRGADVLGKRLRELPRVATKAARETVREETNDIANDMRRGAPVDEGELVKGIQEELLEKGLTGRAVSTARHTTFVVHGTSRMPARDFMTPVAVRSRKRFPKLLRAKVDKALGKLGNK